jgi:hypothetical protein
MTRCGQAFIVRRLPACFTKSIKKKIKTIYMKLIPFFILFVMIQVNIFSQSKLPDGLYLVEQLDVYMSQFANLNSNRTTIRFNPLFTADNPEDYNAMLVHTDEFVPFELSMPPIVQYQNNRKKILLLKLTDEATEKLRVFTTRHPMRQVVLVVDGEALSVHTVTAPVTSGLLPIIPLQNYVCTTLFTRLAHHVKN